MSRREGQAQVENLVLQGSPESGPTLVEPSCIGRGRRWACHWPAAGFQPAVGSRAGFQPASALW